MSKKGGSDRAAKLIEDKTFGLKNKSQFARALLTSSQDMLNHPHPPLLPTPPDKSRKVQEYVKAVAHTVKDGLERKAKAGLTPEQLEAEKSVVDELFLALIGQGAQHSPPTRPTPCAPHPRSPLSLSGLRRWRKRRRRWRRSLRL